MRKPLQGIWNIIRFNWPFYALSLGLVLLILLIRYYSNGPITLAADVFLVLIIGPMLFSLLISFYVYDLSGLYKLSWLETLPCGKGKSIVNINAGFDETSSLIEDRLEGTKMIVWDFYDPAKHTEASIKRARKAYPPFPGTRTVSTSQLPVKNDWADKIFVILSAHEIREAEERNAFFSELYRVLSVSGRIVVVEHLRDAANFLAYNIGAFHFHSRSVWLSTFKAARLNVESETKITPFITVFFLNKNGIES